MLMSEMFRVGIAQMNICKTPDRIMTAGLGSCIGIVLYDEEAKVAGLVHIMLPDSTKIKNNANELKFADTGIDALVFALEEKGISRRKLKAKIAGGACMFTFTANEIGSIGRQNIDAVHSKLDELGIKLIAEDVGEKYGRTIIFDPSNFELEIKITGRQKMII